MAEIADVLRGNDLDSVHRALHGSQTNPSSPDLTEQRFSQFPPPYRSSPSGPTMQSASPDPVDVQQSQEEVERRRVIERHEAYLPDGQLAAEIADEERHMFEASLNGRSDVIPPLTIYRQARKVVMDRWIEQGIWKEEWNDQFHLEGPWKHEESIHAEGEASGVHNNGMPVSVSIEKQKALERQRQASRPYYRFIYQLSKEREYILANPDMEGDFMTHDINTKAYQNVRQNWAQRGLWDDRWGTIPGMAWKHEEQLLLENNWCRNPAIPATARPVEAPSSAPSLAGFGIQAPDMEPRPGSAGVEVNSQQPGRFNFGRPQAHERANPASSSLLGEQLNVEQQQTVDGEEFDSASFPMILTVAHHDTAPVNSGSSHSEMHKNHIAEASLFIAPVTEAIKPTSTIGSPSPQLSGTGQSRTDTPQEVANMDNIANESPENSEVQPQGKSSASVADSVHGQLVEKEASHEDREQAWRTYFEHLHGPYDLFLERSRHPDAAGDEGHLEPSSINQQASFSASAPQPLGSRKRKIGPDEAGPSQPAKRARLNNDKSLAQEGSPAELVKTSTFPLKKRGRPRKQMVAGDVTSVPLIDIGEAEPESSSLAKPGRKGRNFAGNTPLTGNTFQPATKGRPRGRPRKNAATTSGTASAPIQPSNSPRTRGAAAKMSTSSPRPTIVEKSKSEAREDVPVRKRGRPKKAV